MAVRFILLLLGCGFSWATCLAQNATDPPAAAVTEDPAEAVEVPQTVGVRPESSDAEIAERIEDILIATGRFSDPQAEVNNGVVFLSGATTEPRFREQAEMLALRTEDVVAVVNDIRLLQRPLWDLSPAAAAIRELLADTIQMIPMLGIGLVVILFFWSVAKLITYLSRGMMRRRIESQLLQQVLSTAIVVAGVLIGIYVALRVTDLTRLAMTLVGGTGLLGLALGFAFRDIAENFLSSILISLNHPFRIGDLVEIEGRQGYVQRVTTRGTLLMTIAGDHVQIPNSTVYKSILTNFTSNPNSQFSFTIGIGYDEDVQRAQRILYDCLLSHTAVLGDPSPMVLVDQLGASTVNVKCLFWVDISRHSPLKVCSALLRQAKLVLQQAGVSMPDEAREMLFPQGVPVRMLPSDAEPPTAMGELRQSPPKEKQPKPLEKHLEPDSSDAEGNLATEAVTIQRQSETSQPPDSGPSLVD